MTTDEEDKMRAEYNAFINSCAESYEKKLAEKDAEIESEKLHSSMQFDLINSLKQQLSEANARNARLEVAANTAIYCYDKRPENFAYALEELKAATEENRAANSEAVAAWEAEKLEPLRREVAMLHESYFFAANKGKE